MIFRSLELRASECLALGVRSVISEMRERMPGSPRHHRRSRARHGEAALRSLIVGASWAGMFIIELSYKAGLADIDAHMAAHVSFLKKYYAAGHFVVSGRKIPREGGIIVAVASSREQIETIVQEDPFYTHGLADFRIIEFRASQRANDLPRRIA